LLASAEALDAIAAVSPPMPIAADAATAAADYRDRGEGFLLEAAEAYEAAAADLTASAPRGASRETGERAAETLNAVARDLRRAAGEAPAGTDMGEGAGEGLMDGDAMDGASTDPSVPGQQP
ncbi:MAG: hypothetical protein AAF235_05245, partial [Planctomycetota bacterium]